MTVPSQNRGVSTWTMPHEGIIIACMVWAYCAFAMVNQQTLAPGLFAYATYNYSVAHSMS